MKYKLLLLTLLLSYLASAQPTASTSEYIKVDQFGYLPSSSKIAVISNPEVGFNASGSFVPTGNYQVRRWSDNSVVFSGAPTAWNAGAIHDQSGDQVWWFDFSTVTETGSYYVYDVGNDVRSFQFEIKQGVYKDVLKAAVRMYYYQRVNMAKVAPFADTGYEDGPAFSGTEQDTDCRLVSNTSVATSLDLRGGWFDAGDYNKYINFADGVIHDLLDAFEQNPSIWTDDFNIPESGNCIPDLLDEIKYELDWFLRMQLPDGSVLHKISTTNYNSSSPPSTDTEVRRYAAATASATRSACGAYAHAAIVFRQLGDPAMAAYADVLETAAIDAWTWIQANPSNSNYNNAGFVNARAEDSDYEQDAVLTCAAAYLFALTGDSAYRDFVDSTWPNIHLYQWYYAYVFEANTQNGLLYYAQTAGATAAVAAEIKARYQNSMTGNAENFPSYTNNTDAYRAYMTDNNHVWGNNKSKANKGIMMTNVVYANIDPANNPQYIDAAEGYLHYLHGVNPLNLVYLTNMGALGAENSCKTMYHSWFDDGSAAWDEVGVSTYGPAPGYVVGGANPSFSPDGAYTGPAITPPENQPILKSYKEWNTGWPENSWEITEPSITYQAAYIKLLSYFICREEANAFDLQIKVNLAGAFDGSTMQTTLRDNSLLPGQGSIPFGQPYKPAPWNYAGQEGFGKADYAADVVDWVLVSLRTSTAKADEVFRAAGLLKTDGTVEFLDPCLETTAADGPFYVVVEHRNHLAAMSADPVAISGGSLVFDFRTQASYGAGSLGQQEVSSGVFALWNGDLNASGQIDASDRSLAWNGRNTFGYLGLDANLDGIVDASDRSTTWNMRNRVTAVPF